MLHHLLLKLRSCLPAVGLDGRDVVLADAEVVGQLALGQAVLLAHRLEANGSDLDFHGRHANRIRAAPCN